MSSIRLPSYWCIIFRFFSIADEGRFDFPWGRNKFWFCYSLFILLVKITGLPFKSQQYFFSDKWTINYGVLMRLFFYKLTRAPYLSHRWSSKIPSITALASRLACLSIEAWRVWRRVASASCGLIILDSPPSGNCLPFLGRITSGEGTATGMWKSRERRSPSRRGAWWKGLNWRDMETMSSWLEDSTPTWHSDTTPSSTLGQSARLWGEWCSSSLWRLWETPFTWSGAFIRGNQLQSPQLTNTIFPSTSGPTLEILFARWVWFIVLVFVVVVIGLVVW